MDLLFSQGLDSLDAGLLKSEQDNGKGLISLVQHAAGHVETAVPKALKGEMDKARASEWLLLAKSAGADEQNWCRQHFGSGLQFHGRNLLTELALLQQHLDRTKELLFVT